MDCPCAALDDALAACETLRAALLAKDREIDRLVTDNIRLRREHGQADILSLKDVARMMGIQPISVYQVAHRKADFPQPVTIRGWYRTDIEQYLTEHPRRGGTAKVFKR